MNKKMEAETKTNNDPKPKRTLKQFWKDNKSSIPFKIVILTFSGGAIALLPYYGLYFVELGLSVSDIAVIFLLVPFASLLGPILSGLLADKLGTFSLIFAANIFLTLVFYNLTLLIPKIEPKTEVFTFQLSDDHLQAHFHSCTDCFKEILEPMENFKIKNCKPCSKNDLNGDDCINYTPISDNYCLIHLESEEMTFKYARSNGTHNPSLCIFEETKNTSTSNVSYVESGAVFNSSEDCHFRCEISEDVIKKCDTSSSISSTFILVTLTVFTGSIFLASAFTMLDTTIIQFAKENDTSIGKHKMMIMFAYGTVPLLSGFLIDYYSKKLGRRTYVPTFMLGNVLLCITCGLTFFVTIKGDVNDSNILKDFRKLVTRLDVDLFLLLTLILGSNFGFIESYLFLYLRSLDAPNILIGLTMTVGCFSSIPMLFCSDWLENKVGRHVIFLICFTAYAIRMIGYSFIVNPWMCLIFESLESITYQLMWVTCLKLCPLLAPKGLLATMTGISGAVHYSFGRGIGGFIGGQLIALFGMRIAFRAFGGLALCGGIFYLIIHYSYLKRKIEERENELKMEAEINGDEEGNPMLQKTTDKSPPLYDKATTMDLHHSFMALAGPRSRLSIDAAFSSGNFKKVFESSKETRRASHGGSDAVDEVINSSLPYLYVAETNNIIGPIDLKGLSKSDGNIDK